MLETLLNNFSITTLDDVLDAIKQINNTFLWLIIIVVFFGVCGIIISRTIIKKLNELIELTKTKNHIQCEDTHIQIERDKEE